jgi:hypothetical protein
VTAGKVNFISPAHLARYIDKESIAPETLAHYAAEFAKDEASSERSAAAVSGRSTNAGNNSSSANSSNNRISTRDGNNGDHQSESGISKKDLDDVSTKGAKSPTGVSEMSSSRETNEASLTSSTKLNADETNTTST